MQTKPKRCISQRLDGKPCQAPATVGHYCFAHDPGGAARREQARRKGGQNSRKIVRLRGLVPPRLVAVYDRLEDALSEVHGGTLDPRQAGAMAALARAMVAVLTSGELEERVRDIEFTIGENHK